MLQPLDERVLDQTSDEIKKKVRREKGERGNSEATQQIQTSHTEQSGKSQVTTYHTRPAHIYKHTFNKVVVVHSSYTHTKCVCQRKSHARCLSEFVFFSCLAA